MRPTHYRKIIVQKRNFFPHAINAQTTRIIRNMNSRLFYSCIKTWQVVFAHEEHYIFHTGQSIL